MQRSGRIYPRCQCGHSKSVHGDDGCRWCDYPKMGTTCTKYTLPRPKARKPIKPKTGKPKRFAGRRNEEYAAWIRTQPCIMTSLVCMGKVQSCHVKSRAAGGDDEGNCVSMCAVHHHAQHSMGIKTFQREYGIDLKRVATELWAEYEHLRERKEGR